MEHKEFLSFSLSLFSWGVSGCRPKLGSKLFLIANIEHFFRSSLWSIWGERSPSFFLFADLMCSSLAGSANWKCLDDLPWLFL
jgi:hypothetical protein